MHFYIEPDNTLFNRFDKFMYSINESYLKGTVKIAPLTGYSQAVLSSVHSGWRFVTPKEDLVPGTDGKNYKLTVNNRVANSMLMARRSLRSPTIRLVPSSCSTTRPRRFS